MVRPDGGPALKVSQEGAEKNHVMEIWGTTPDPFGPYAARTLDADAGAGDEADHRVEQAQEQQLGRGGEEILPTEAQGVAKRVAPVRVGPQARATERRTEGGALLSILPGRVLPAAPSAPCLSAPLMAGSGCISPAFSFACFLEAASARADAARCCPSLLRIRSLI